MKLQKLEKNFIKTSKNESKKTQGEYVIFSTAEQYENQDKGVIKRNSEDLWDYYQYHAIVHAVINKIQKRIASAGYFFSKNGNRLGNEDPMIDYIERVFSGERGKDSLLLQLRRNVLNWLIVGDSYIERLGSNIRIQRLHTISSKYMRKKIISKNELKYYQVYNEQVVAEWTEKDMFSESLDNGNLYGISPLMAAQKELLIDLSAIIFNKSFFENGATPTTVFKLRDELTQLDPSRFDDIRKQLMDQYSSARNGNKPIFNNFIEDVKIVDRDLNKIQFLGSRDKFIEKICACFDISKAMIGITDSANEATASNTMQQEFYRTAVRPYEEMLERWFNREVFPAIGLSGISITIKEEIFVDDTEKTNLVLKQRDSGLITTNQAREELGLPLIEADWADKIMIRDNTGMLVEVGSVSQETKNLFDLYADEKSKR